MSGDVFIYFCFLDICWFETFGNLFESCIVTIFLIFTLTPPFRVNYSINRSWFCSFLRDLTFLMWIINLISSLRRISMQVLFTFIWVASSPGGWSLGNQLSLWVTAIFWISHFVWTRLLLSNSLHLNSIFRLCDINRFCLFRLAKIYWTFTMLPCFRLFIFVQKFSSLPLFRLFMGGNYKFLDSTNCKMS